MTFDSIRDTVDKAIKDSANREALWVALVSGLGCKSVCEIGVWKGQFAERLLSEVDQIKHYTLIDPWQNLPDWNKPANKSDIEFDSIRAEALSRVSPYAEKIIELRDTTKNAGAKIGDGTLDFAYIDGDHTLRGITLDLHIMLPKIRKGGFIGGDDFSKSIWQHNTDYSPTEVFPYAIYFAEAQDLPIFTLPFNQFLILNDPQGFEVVDYGDYASLTPADIYTQPKPTGIQAVQAMVPEGLKNTLKTILKR